MGMQETPELRRNVYGATYRLTRHSGASDQYVVMADGVMLIAPTTYERALEGFRALTA